MRRFYLIDHKHLFLFGYIFYLFTPYFVGANNLFEGFPGMELYHRYFHLIPADQLGLYMLITLSWGLAFLLGHCCFKLLVPYKRTLEPFSPTATSYAVSYVGIVLCVVFLAFVYLARNSIFGGYGSYDISARGKMSTLLVIFNFFLLYQLVSRQRTSIWLIAGTIVTALVLLSMGGRLYVMQTFIVLLIFKTSFSIRKWNGSKILGFSLAAFLIASAFGIWRMGSTLGFDKAAYLLFAEPSFTWFSTSTYLASNEIQLISMPWNYLTSFFNLVPNTIVSLEPYVISTYSMVKDYQSPLGADSVWSNIVINFGSVGSFFFVFFTGFMLNWLRHLSENSRFWAVYYIMVCGMLPFQFFRDGFYIVHKQLFFNFLILPAIILIILKMIIYLQSSLGKKPLQGEVNEA